MDLERYRQEAGGNEYFRLNHIHIASVEPDCVVLTVTLCPELTNPYGMAHGGLLFTMSDCCAGLTARTNGKKCVTLDAEMHYLHNVSSGVLTAKSRVIRRGSTICLLEVVITDESGKSLTEGIFTMFYVSTDK